MEESTVIAIVIKTKSSDQVELSEKFFHQTLKGESSKKPVFLQSGSFSWLTPPLYGQFFVILLPYLFFPYLSKLLADLPLSILAIDTAIGANLVR